VIISPPTLTTLAGHLRERRIASSGELIRQATEQFLMREDPKGDILKAAKKLVEAQSESVDQRVTEPLTSESTAQIAALIKGAGSG
jgi:hypothetical protein